MKIRRVLFWLTLAISIIVGVLLTIFANSGEVFYGWLDFSFLFIIGFTAVWIPYFIGKFIESTVIIIKTLIKGGKLLLEKKKSKSTKLHKTACILLAIIILVCLFVFMGILPTFKTIFESFGKELPAPTAVLLIISDLLVNYFYIFIPLIIVLYILVVILMKRFSQELQKFILFLIIIGPFFMVVLIVCVMFMPMFAGNLSN